MSQIEKLERTRRKSPKKRTVLEQLDFIDQVVPGPIEFGVVAAQFRPIYRMHRYFARRPHNLFEHIISHYTQPNDIVLDPFSGGGVTPVESALLGRRSVAIDINPLAGFITKNELSKLDIGKVQKAFSDLSFLVSEKINSLYGDGVSWIEWVSLISCDSCSSKFSVSEAKKLRAATWQCPKCRSDVRHTTKKDTKFEIASVFSSNTTSIREGNSSDKKAFKKAYEIFAKEVDTLPIPSAKIPDNNMQRESALFKKGFTHFTDFFTERNLLANGILLKAIDQDIVTDEASKEFIKFVFSSSLRYTNRMVTRNESWRGNKPLEWSQPGFWMPASQLETNVWEQFSARFSTAIKAKSKFQESFTTQLKISRSACDVTDGRADVAIVSSSSTKIDLKDKSVHAIVTDPPYGNYLHYADLSNFWTVWLAKHLGIGGKKGQLGLIDNALEAVPARKKGFEGAKSFEDCTKLMTECFSECHRVLKDNGWMVLTFNNREPRAWLSLIIAILESGFELPEGGVIFQDGVSSYKHTSQSRRSGSVIGDFVYSFKKASTTALHARVPVSEDQLIAKFKKEMIKKATKIISREGSVSSQDLFTSLYLELQPFIFKMAGACVGSDANTKAVLNVVDQLTLMDSHRGQELKDIFEYRNNCWHLKK